MFNFFNSDVAKMIVTAGVTLLAVVIGSFLNQRRDRQRLIWEQNLKTLHSIEQSAGYLMQHLPSYFPSPQGSADDPLTLLLQERFKHYADASAALFKYPEMAEPMEEFRHASGIVFNTMRMDRFDTKAERDATLARLQSSYAELIKACERLRAKT